MNKVIEWTVLQLMTDTAVLAEQRDLEELMLFATAKLCND
jgi:hypothetical protein